MERVAEHEPYEVFAWGYGFVGARPTLDAAQMLAAGYDGARIITYENGGFQVVAELGRYAVARAGAGKA